MKSFKNIAKLTILVFILSIGHGETITIYATQSVQIRGEDEYCCSPVYIVQNNSNEIWSRGCYVYGICMLSAQAPIWRFDTNTIPDGLEINNVSFKGNAPYPWQDTYQIFSISNDTGEITSDMGVSLMDGGDWSLDNYYWSGNFSQSIPTGVFESLLGSGQINVLAFNSDISVGAYVQNTGTNAPRLVIEYEESFAPQTLINPEHNSIVEFSNSDLNNLFYFEWAEASNFGDADYYLEFDSYLSALPVTMINNTTASVSYESIQSIMDSLSIVWLVGNWDVMAINDGDTIFSENGPFYVMFHSTTLGVEDDPIPNSIALHPAYPNPFNPTTTIRFDVPNNVETMHTSSLRIFDINGRVVETLFQGTIEPRTHEAQWDASAHPSGVYLAVLETGTTRQTQKLILLK